MLENLTCKDNQTIIDALRKIDLNVKGALFVVDESDRFLGTLTDGDIRRAILSKKGTETLLSELLVGKDSVSMPISTPVRELLQTANKKIKIIPLLDQDGKVADYFEYKADFHAPIASTNLIGNELAYVIECVTTNWISSQGEFVSRFEKGFSEYIGTNQGVAVMNGTVALHLALLALGIGPGDEVIVPDLTFAATINAVLYTGARPVIVDVEFESWCIGTKAIEQAITSKTKAIIPVHLYGQPCDMPAIMKLADKHGIKVIEDCAEAHGAEIGGQKVGSFGHINCYSFFGNKILTTGEGGMCLTDDVELADKMRQLRDHGMDRKKRYWHQMVGYNYRITNLQAAIGVGQLERIDAILEKRTQIRKWYEAGLADAPEIEVQKSIPGRKSVTWLYSATLKHGKISRDLLIDKLKLKSVDLRPFFYPLSQMDIYKEFAKNPTPISNEVSAQGLSFPTVLSMNEEDYLFICDKIKECL